MASMVGNPTGSVGEPGGRTGGTAAPRGLAGGALGRQLAQENVRYKEAAAGGGARRVGQENMRSKQTQAGIREQAAQKAASLNIKQKEALARG